MANKVHHIPEGFHTATPYLMVKDATNAIDFYQKAFGAIILERLEGPDGRVMHAEIKIGDSPVMIGEHHDVASLREQSLPPVSIYLYVEDADATASQAVAAGAKELYPVEEKFYGNREGGIEDPFGITWWIATRVQSLSSDELQQRTSDYMKQRA
jgi:PhnB protein